MKRKFRIITIEHDDSVEWELIEVLGGGYSQTEPDAYDDAENVKRKVLSEKPATAPITTGTVAPNQATPVVNQELTQVQRALLYSIVYGAHMAIEQNDLMAIENSIPSRKEIHELLAKLSE